MMIGEVGYVYLVIYIFKSFKSRESSLFGYLSTHFKFEKCKA